MKTSTTTICRSILFQTMKISVAQIWQKLRYIQLRKKGRKYAVRFSERIKEIKLDLGCGPAKRAGFIGVDLNRSADLRWDIRWGLPFEADSILEIRSDHFFEHIGLSDVVNVFSECRRVLVPNGILNFTVPHLDPYIDAYLNRDYQFISEKINDIPQDQESLYNTCFDRICWLLHRAGEHKSMFDKDSIIAKLSMAGFAKIRIREFDPAIDDNWRFSSIYVVAVK